MKKTRTIQPSTNETITNDTSEDEDNEKDASLQEKPLQLKNVTRTRTSAPSSGNTEKTSGKSRPQCANISDEEFNWNELDKDSVINTDHKKEEFHQGATIR